MAIDNNFKVWVNDVSGTPSPVPLAEDFINDNTNTDRTQGFQSGTAASSQWVNGGLRQANLFVASFMEAVKEAGIDISSLNLRSSVNALKTAIQNYEKVYNHIFYLTTIDTDLNSYNVYFSIVSKNKDSISNGSFTTLAQYLQSKGAINPIIANGVCCFRYASSGDYKVGYISSIISDYSNNTYKLFLNSDFLSDIGYGNQLIAGFQSFLCTTKNVQDLGDLEVGVTALHETVIEL